MEWKIRHEQNVRTGNFYINKDCDRIAFLYYFEDPEGVLQLIHTFVSDELRGQQIASKLVAYAIEYAQNNKLKLQAICPYVVKWFERYPDKKDILV
ncbi:MAG: GNAT family N-acetyltransferase [Bacteroidales bacterium]|jgi:predicted GNAT family acetyltransferase|nr:N-acetyltransferase [Bacteroidales bacterium]MDD3702231.1 GNAT family N-acetyltransferase [Bacteroidales bacterium]MDY0368894.1 GNAT family N-acetyltransferase [Bacteroidales bacterium]